MKRLAREIGRKAGRLPGRVFGIFLLLLVSSVHGALVINEIDYD